MYRTRNGSNRNIDARKLIDGCIAYKSCGPNKLFRVYPAAGKFKVTIVAKDNWNSMATLVDITLSL